MEKRKTVKFGVVGCGLMGREFASAAARWCHLVTDLPRPEIVAVCDLNESARAWFTDNFSSVHLSTPDLGELLAAPETALFARKFDYRTSPGVVDALFDRFG